MTTMLERQKKRIEQWQQDYEVFMNSGESLTAFSRKLGIAPNSLGYRFQQVRKYHQTQPRLLPVSIVSPVEPDQPLESSLCTLDFGNGRSLRIHDERALTELCKLIKGVL